MRGPERDRHGPELASALGRLEALVESFEGDPSPATRNRVFAMLQAVDSIHRAGLNRLAALLDESGGQIREQALADPAVRLLFELYDLLPDTSSGFIPLEELEQTPGARP